MPMWSEVPMEPTNTDSEHKLETTASTVRDTEPCPAPMSSYPPSAGTAVEFPSAPRLPNFPGVVFK
jgi:hypothetical protein